MQIRKIPLRKTLNPAYRKQKVNRELVETFKEHFLTLLQRISTEESEENAKFHLTEFLNKVYYQGNYLLATKERADLVIHNGKSVKTPAGVLLETKRPQQGDKTAADMITAERPNAKALHELLLYFLRERIENQNTDLKHLIITDIYHWYIFSASDFEKHFYQNKRLVKDYKAWRDGRKSGSKTDFFYQEIAQPFIENMEATLDCGVFDLRDFQKVAENKDDRDDKKLIPLIKVLSPEHLLRLPFANDSNSLNKNFYYELLHIIGLEETKIKNKKVIQRKAKGKRDDGSLLENAIRTLQTEDRLRRVPKLSSYGSTTEEQLFGVGLELSITWINRILFLKLLEAQLLKYHRGDKQYRFLNSQLLTDYDEVNELFFEALAKTKDQRPDYVADKFARIPYLNSSLFEISPVEDTTIRINSMKDRFDLPLYSKTVLKTEQGKRQTGKMKVLDYLFAFLDAYDFSSEGSEDIQEENKTLINASVLGLIFEKINGYQDGAFFTPGFITMYMCRETLRRATIQKFVESDHFAEFEGGSFTDLQHYLGRKYRQEDLQTANELINSLKICDPAVGSGHFLVSALNELLTIKSELGILIDRQGKPLPIRIEVANDELVVQWRNNDDFFEYTPGASESQRVQEALFHEKQYLIENCLFGVDLNPNSVKICRLRLWIELLKHTYYRNGKPEHDLETLPNIDINIKEGNSLISRFALDADLKPALKKSKWKISDYQLAVSSYQQAQSKEDKRQLLEQIDRIKNDFETHIYGTDPRIKRLSKLRGQKLLLENKTEIGDLFEKLSEADVADDLQKIDQKIEKLEAEIEEARNAAIYRDAFEWRFEFPEVLDEEGDFVGFDVILGNPPYISVTKLKEFGTTFKERYDTYSKGTDLYCLFIELGSNILKQGGVLNFITSNSWLRAIYGDDLKIFLKEKTQPLSLINIEDAQIFDEATVEANMLFFEKGKMKESFSVCNIRADFKVENSLSDYVLDNSFEFKIPESNDWVISGALDYELKLKIETNSKPLKEFGLQINFGVKTGFNKAFIIDQEKRDELIKLDPKNDEIIKPILRGRDLKKYSYSFSNIYLISTFPSLKIDINNYKSIEYHLLSFGRKRLEQSGEKGSRKKTRNLWFETQDSIAYWEDFEKPKIIWGEISDKPKFAFDDEGYYAEATTFIMTGEHLKYLLAILNSNISEWYFNQIGTTTGMGTNRWKKYKIELLPIKDLSSLEQIPFINLVNQIISDKKLEPLADTTHLEAQIDLLVYQLYGLTYEEVLLVDPEFEMEEAEYEALIEKA
jgi:type II restriction/modification system DNA methylase subunit YeeA